MAHQDLPNPDMDATRYLDSTGRDDDSRYTGGRPGDLIEEYRRGWDCGTEIGGWPQIRPHL
jgi:hypothetical protein